MIIPLLAALAIFLFGVLAIAIVLNIRHSKIPLKKRLRCWALGHVWFEHWNATKIDHCTKCDLEQPHRSEGCTCTICRWPGGLEKWVEWVQETSQAAKRRRWTDGSPQTLAASARLEARDGPSLPENP